MSPELTTKLVRLQNRATRYELIATGLNGEKVLVGYCRKGRPAMLSMIQKHGEVWAKVTGADAITWGRKHLQHVMAMGTWLVAFSGRTQREAYIGGEVQFVTDYAREKAITA